MNFCMLNLHLHLERQKCLDKHNCSGRNMEKLLAIVFDLLLIADNIIFSLKSPSAFIVVTLQLSYQI